MNKVILEPRKPYYISRANLDKECIDIGGRDIIIGFNEPAPKVEKGGRKLYSTLNARLPAYFLPAVDVAMKQPKRPRFYLMSAINIAMKWSARSEKERHTMLAHNKIKFDFYTQINNKITISLVSIY